MSFPITYIFNNTYPFVPPGAIVSYIGKDTPDGWLPCNGQPSTVTDGRYVYLAPLLNTLYGVNTNTSNSVTTPDLQGRFLYGAPTYSSLVNTTGGSSTVTLSTSNLPSHNHGFQQGSTTQYLHNNTKGNFSVGSGSNFFMHGAASSTPGSNETLITVDNTGSGTSFSILPPYFTANYIIKY